MLLIDREARKWQARDRFTDDDIRHAVEHAMGVLGPGQGPWEGTDDMTLFLGPAGGGRLLLEVIVLAALDEDEDDQPSAIHAMRMRNKFLPYLSSM